MAQFIYHLKPNKFKGKSLLPLSTLEERYPEFYEQEIEKYDGRDSDMNRKIHPLNCRWRDVINLSTINPIKLLSVAELIGNETDPATILKIPVSKLKEMKMCLYDGNTGYKLITMKAYKEVLEIPEATIKHYMKCKENDERPLVFEGVPHILVADEINISDVETIKYRPGKMLLLATAYERISLYA